LGTGVTSIRRETLGGQLFELLRHRILTGELSGGRRLVQGELAGELRVSRIPVRDALRRLEAEGLVEGDDVGRYSVIPFTRDDAAEVYAIRRRLEPLAAALAARKATNEELDEIRALFEAMDSVVREAGPKLDVDHSVRFHMAIYEASRARRLVRMIKTLWSGVPPLTPISLGDRMRNSHSEHRTLVERLLARDAEGAAAALERHIRNAEEELGLELTRNRHENGNRQEA